MVLPFFFRNLTFWFLQNYTREKETRVKMTEDGDVVLKGGGKSEYLRPKDLREVAGCLNNWRSAWARLWPWSYEPEVFCKIMEDYCYLQVSRVVCNCFNKLRVCFVTVREEEERPGGEDKAD